jgi:Protein of unknown function (DUF3179)
MTSDSPHARSRARLSARVILAASACAVVLAAVLSFGLDSVIQSSKQTAATEADRAFANSTPFIWPGIDHPKTLPAEKAHVQDQDQVIGVEVDGKARAYLISAFSGIQHHVVNDVLGGQAVSVTHCDITHCTKVFSDPGSQEVLSIACGGRRGDSLLLLARGGFFVQDSGTSLVPGGPAFPFPELPFVVTTWGQWKQAHPNTDVYESAPPSSGNAAMPPAAAKNSRP